MSHDICIKRSLKVKRSRALRVDAKIGIGKGREHSQMASGKIVALCRLLFTP